MSVRDVVVPRPEVIRMATQLSTDMGSRPHPCGSSEACASSPVDAGSTAVARRAGLHAGAVRVRSAVRLSRARSLVGMSHWRGAGRVRDPWCIAQWWSSDHPSWSVRIVGGGAG